MGTDIYRIIKDRILSLEYAPGSILNEKKLADEFGVSRTPMRSVLNRLESDQLVRVIPRTGVLVAEIEYQKIMNTFQVRMGIDEMTGTLAAENAAPEEHFEHLERLLKKCDELFSQRDKAKLMAIDREVRSVLNDITNNPVLKHISESLYDHTVRLWCIVLDKGDWKEEVESVKEDITRTLRALKDEPKKLGKLRRELLVQHIERIKRKFLGE